MARTLGLALAIVGFVLVLTSFVGSTSGATASTFTTIITQSTTVVVVSATSTTATVTSTSGSQTVTTTQTSTIVSSSTSSGPFNPPPGSGTILVYVVQQTGSSVCSAATGCPLAGVPTCAILVSQANYPPYSVCGNGGLSPVSGPVTFIVPANTISGYCVMTGPPPSGYLPSGGYTGGCGLYQPAGYSVTVAPGQTVSVGFAFCNPSLMLPGNSCPSGLFSLLGGSTIFGLPSSFQLILGVGLVGVGGIVMVRKGR